MKVVFFGTPEFGVPTLEALTCGSPAGMPNAPVAANAPTANRHEVLAVVTQPSRRRRRRGKTEPSPVNLAARRVGVMVIETERVRHPDVIEILRGLRPDAAVVVAYGEILPREILTTPTRGCINVHPSLLPRYRGAAPIQWAIINGDTTTGVCTMLLDEGMDTGPVFMCVQEPIAEDDTAETLGQRLAQVGAGLLLSTLDAIEHDGLTPRPQSGTATTARPLKKEDALINWNLPARDIVNLIRGLHPWPGSYTYVSGQRVKILKATVKDDVSGDIEAATVVKRDTDSLVVATGCGLLSIDVVQPEGKNAMSAGAYIRGRVRGQGDIVVVG
ncbi:MAG: methionyl-tRNA formyltransferase [Nitrospirae bacterium]|nr:methionyl-tRNA formyltransferase [Nitrospirota bacterium]